jgi:hypothetical protein
LVVDIIYTTYIDENLVYDMVDNEKRIYIPESKISSKEEVVSIPKYF